MSNIESVEEIQQNLEEPQEEKREVLKLSDKIDNVYKSLDEDQKQAWNQGWRPQDLFVGKNRDGSSREWVDHKTFLERAKNNLPVVNDRNRELAKEIDKLKEELKNQKKALTEAEKRGYEKALVEIETKQRAAVEIGDVDEFEKLKKEEREIMKKLPTVEVVEDFIEQQPQQQSFLPQDQEVLNDWQARNMWIRTDAKLAAYAIESEKQLLKDKPYLTLRERLDIVEQEVKEVFYNKFNTPKPDSMFSSQATGGFGSSEPKTKSFSDLPDAARKTCESLIKLRGIDQKGAEAIKAFKQNYAKAHFNNI